MGPYKRGLTFRLGVEAHFNTVCWPRMYRLFNSTATAWYHRVLGTKAAEWEKFSHPRRIGLKTQSFVVNLLAFFAAHESSLSPRWFEPVAVSGGKGDHGALAHDDPARA